MIAPAIDQAIHIGPGLNEVFFAIFGDDFDLPKMIDPLAGTGFPIKGNQLADQGADVFFPTSPAANNRFIIRSWGISRIKTAYSRIGPFR